MSFDKPNIFVCGPSGSGKSTSLRNLNPDTTIILNTEREELPFKAAKLFKRKVQIDSLEKFEAAINKALEAEGCEVIVIESFTALCELVYKHVIRNSDGEGFALWQKYKDTIHDILLACKVSDRHVVFLGIDDVIQDEQLRMYRTVFVQGSLKGKIEKEFQIVLWTRAHQGLDGPVYEFVTNTDGVCKAKTPLGMFDEQYIPNDLNFVISSINDYYTGE